MAVFAVLVVTAAVQTSRNSVSDERERRELAGQVDRRPHPARRRPRRGSPRLQREARRLQARQLAQRHAPPRGCSTSSTLLGVHDRRDRRSRGPGVRVVADDAPGADSARNEVLDTDLQKLVNGLWEAGAEAISINGQRLTNLSTIRLGRRRHHGQRPLAAAARTSSRRSATRTRCRHVSRKPRAVRHGWTCSARSACELTITPESSLRLPAAEVSLRYANQKQPGGAS